MKKLILIVVLAVLLCPLFTNYKDKEISAIMAITESTLNTIIGFEGKRNKAYQDTRGLWTIGVGHLIKSDEQHLINTVLTDEQVHTLLKRDLSWCDEAITSSVRVPLNQNQYDALYSLCFNIGASAFKASSVVKKLNEKDYEGAANAFLLWNKPAILLSRRESEKKLFLTPIKGENT
jgi:lysozyme